MIVIFAGSIGRFPVGGHAWVDMQYLLGLAALGHDVFYLEDCGEGSWVYNWESEEVTTDLAYPAGYVRECLDSVGLGGRWIYRAGERCAGMSTDELRDVCSAADLLIVRGSPLLSWWPEYARPRRRIFVDSDPAFTQFGLANGNAALCETVDRCERLFTIGQRIGSPDCPVPTGGRRWLKTVPPVFLTQWPMQEDEPTHFTSVLQWRSYRAVAHGGVRYGNKNLEFPKFLGLPRLVEQPFRMALTGAEAQTLTDQGWEVVPGWVASRTPEAYRSFVQRSRAEFGVAKHGYVLARVGWFSDRSVCYLASGRPVLVQDTGVSEWLPTGEGLLTFRDVAEARAGVEAINADYDRHRRAARRLAETEFEAERVLTHLLEDGMS
jgi:hypothetical protein